MPALEGFLGTDAGLSAATITRLTVQWQDEARAFGERDLSGMDYVYLWADGIHVNIRLDEEKLCLLVLIGVRVDGTKQLVALTDGYRESTGSWADLLRDCKRRGMRAPVLAAGDGALGFWGALREVFPETKEQRCWFHKIGNVLSALPKSAHPAAKKALGVARRCRPQALHAMASRRLSGRSGAPPGITGRVGSTDRGRRGTGLPLQSRHRNAGGGADSRPSSSRPPARYRRRVGGPCRCHRWARTRLRSAAERAGLGHSRLSSAPRPSSASASPAAS